MLWGLVILVAAIQITMSCQIVTAPEMEKIPDGMLAIKVNSGNSAARALEIDTAKNAVNFYEVIFKNGTEYTRTAWYKGQPARLAVPPANYDGTTASVILLAGTNNAGTHGRDYTLLAVGALTHTSPDNGATKTAGTNITANTNWVQFTLYALEAAPSTENTSSFKITGPNTPIDYKTIFPVPTAKMDAGGKMKVPYFTLPKDKTLTAEYKIDALTNTVYTSKKLGEFVLFHDTQPPLTSGGVFSDQDVGVSLVDEGTATKITNTAGSPLTTGVIKMDLKTPNTDGLSMLQIDAQVVGIASHTDTDGIIWHIRGGLFNYQLDSINGASTGPTNTTGGGILLAVGTAGSEGIKINAVPDGKVTVSPKTATVAQGGTKQFTASVYWPGSPTVAWSLTGGTGSTGINPTTGLLTVDAAETVGTILTVTATSNATGTPETDTATVTIVAP
jgi:hypothetical protein